MALTATTSLAIASLVIYLILFPLISYIAWSHGRHGLLAWLFLSAFAILQIVSGGILASANGQPSFAGSIITSVGLSPLLLAELGILHEVRHHLPSSPLHRRLFLFLAVQNHALISAGITLLAVGASDVLSAASASPPTAPSSSSLTLWKVGAALLFVSWLVLILLFVATLVHVNKSERSGQLVQLGRQGQDLKTLLWAGMLSLPFVGVRTVYGLVHALTQRRELSPVVGSVAIKVVLIFLPQVVAVGLLVLGGLRTRGLVGRGGKEDGEGGVRLVRR